MGDGSGRPHLPGTYTGWCLVSAPESFIEIVRQQLVLVRRNAERALAQQDGGHYGDSKQYLATALHQAKALERDVAEAAQREICTCPCGHVHYLHGDAA